MRIVYVSRSNSGKPHAFVKEQADVLIKNYNVQIEHFLISSGGVRGYSNAILQLFKLIKDKKIDIIHVHYGLWAFVAVLNKFLFFKNYKIVVTYHGSDINKKSERRISLMGSYFSSHNIIVSEKMLQFFQKNYSIIPCGIDTNIQLNYRNSTRIENGWNDEDFIVLFASSFDRPEKDPGFAQKVIEVVSKSTTLPVKLIELKGFTRDQLTKLMQAADAILMCSISEGSPQVIKEAILNALPVVSNDVGDVKSICSGVDNCFIIPKSVDEYVKCLLHLSRKKLRIQNREPVLKKFDNNIISQKLYNIYSDVLR